MNGASGANPQAKISFWVWRGSDMVVSIDQSVEDLAS
jgi:hypothetical protein